MTNIPSGDSWKQPAAQELKERAAREQEYLKGYRDGKKEAYIKARQVGLAVVFVLMGFAFNAFLIVYMVITLFMAYLGFKRDDERFKWHQRILPALLEGILWPFFLWQEAMQECQPPKKKDDI